MIDNGHWTHTEQMDSGKYFGFIYLIEDKIDGKLYIGKKQYLSVTKLPPLKGKKRKRTKISEMSWRDYTSSSSYVNDAIEKHGIKNFEFSILTECISKADLTYQEVAIMHELEVLTTMKEDGTPRYYNRAIGNIKFIPPLKISDETRKKMSVAGKESWKNSTFVTCEVCEVELHPSHFAQNNHGKDCNYKEGYLTCSNCGTQKEENEFWANRSRPNKKDPECKDCKRSYQLKSRDRIAVYRKRYTKANKEEIARKDKEYRMKNKDKINKRARERYKLKKESK